VTGNSDFNDFGTKIGSISESPTTHPCARDFQTRRLVSASACYRQLTLTLADPSALADFPFLAVLEF
jgi:hypothetical protein